MTVCAQIVFFFSSTGLKLFLSLSFKLQIRFQADSVIFLTELLNFKQKNLFLILTPDISRTKQHREIKKKQIDAERCSFHEQPSDFHNFTFFFQLFDLLKNAKKRRGEQKERGTCGTRYPTSVECESMK